MKDNTRMFAGMEIGDRYSEICLHDAQGEIVERRRIATTSTSLIKYFSPKVPPTLARETCGRALDGVDSRTHHANQGDRQIDCADSGRAIPDSRISAGDPRCRSRLIAGVCSDDFGPGALSPQSRCGAVSVHAAASSSER